MSNVWFFITFRPIRWSPCGSPAMAGMIAPAGSCSRERRPPIESFSVTRDASGLAAGGQFNLAGGGSIAVRSLGRAGGFWLPMSWERSAPTMSAYDEFCPFRTDDGTEGFGVAEHGSVRKLY